MLKSLRKRKNSQISFRLLKRKKDKYKFEKEAWKEHFSRFRESRIRTNDKFFDTFSSYRRDGR